MSYQVVTNPFLNIFIQSSLTSIRSEKRFAKDLSIQELKGKLELITGASPASMKIQAQTHEGVHVCNLDEDSKLLGSYPIDDGMILMVKDESKPSGEFDDVSKVQKYELSEEEYSKKQNTVKSYLLNNKLGKYNEEELSKKQEEIEEERRQEEEKANSITVGSRCEVSVPGHPNRRGTVRFVGTVHFKPGYWAGIHYDEPFGKNDGSIEGKRYFDCPPKYGSFVKVGNVTVGEFPEEVMDLDEF